MTDEHPPQPSAFPSFLFWLALAVALAGLVGRPAHAETISMESTATGPGSVERISGDLRLPPGTGPFPAVILMHGCAGLTLPVLDGLNRHSNALVAAGFAVLLLDSFTSRGNQGGKVCRSTDALVLAQSYRSRDAVDALNALAARSDIDAHNIFLMGQSIGGSVAMYAAKADLGFRAVVAYYPWCGIFPGSGTRIAAPLLVMIGSGDDWTLASLCEDLDGKVRGKSFEVVVYPGATHSFDLPIPPVIYQGHAMTGDPAATRDSRDRMIAFFRRHLAR